LYRDEDATNITDLDVNIETSEGVDSLAGFGNDSVDPVFEDIDGPDDSMDTWMDNDWHLTASSPESVTEGGLDLSELLTTDRDNMPRTDDGAGTGWSRGAYEY
jgi:hypothetical protein